MAGDAPKDYVEFYGKYKQIVSATARRFHLQLSYHDYEDFVEELMDEFVALDYLNPDAGGFRDYPYVDKDGRQRYAKFSTFLYHFIRNRVYNKRTQLNKRNRMVDIHKTDGNDYYCQLVADDEPKAEVDFYEVVQQIHERLSKIPVHKGAKRDMARFFDKLVEQIMEDGDVDRKALCEYFGISQGSLTFWFQALRRCPAINMLE